MGLIALFVVLPLAWPESPDQPFWPRELASLDVESDVTATVFSGDGRHLMVAARGRPVAHWHHGDGDWSRIGISSLGIFEIHSLALAPGELVLAAGSVGGELSLWDLDRGSGRPVAAACGETVEALCFSPDGTVAAANTGSRIVLIDAAEGKVLYELAGHRGPARSLVFAPDGRTLISGGEDGTIRFWDVEETREVAKLGGMSGPIMALALSASGGLLASSSFGEESIRLWEPQSHEARGFLRSDEADVTCLAFSSDGGPLLSGDVLGRVALWNLATARPRVTFQAHRGWVKSLAVAAHGMVLATGGNDGLVKVWDIDPATRTR
jgi:WD40 repeat protein